MKITDAHAHLTFYTTSQLEEFFRVAEDNNISRWVMGGYNAEDWQRQAELKASYPDKIITCYGLHPWQVIALNSSQIEEQIHILEQMMAAGQACGETGLDLYKSKDTLIKQQDIFIRHLELNQQFQKPLVLHIVQAHDPAVEILKNYSFTGIIHGFSGSYEIAKKYVELGYKISVGRGIYYKGYKTLKDTVKKLDLKHFVVESDAENAADEQSVDIFLEVINSVANIKDTSRDKVIEASENNLNQLFG